MNIALITFTKQGACISETIINILENCRHKCWGFKKGSFEDDSGLEYVTESLSSWTEKHFQTKDALIFIGAAGIAVRAVAPFVKSKMTDPACIAIDEMGKYVIPFLSGHIGGANDLARCIAEGLCAVPVITTATDLNGLFAVDEWARKNNMYISDIKKAKKIASDLLQGNLIRVKSQFPIQRPLPKGMVQISTSENFGNPNWGKDEADLEISIAADPGTKKALHLIPRCVYLGIGCRKGTEEQQIQILVKQALMEAGISEESIAGAASIDLKENEKGLVDFCCSRKLPFQVFTAQQLASVPGEFTGSSFVTSVTGVDNVCERAAVLAAGGKLILKKQAQNGVTVAAALRDQNLSLS